MPKNVPKKCARSIGAHIDSGKRTDKKSIVITYGWLFPVDLAQSASILRRIYLLWLAVSQLGFALLAVLSLIGTLFFGIPIGLCLDSGVDCS